VELLSIVFFKIEDAALVIFDFVSAFNSCFPVNFLLQFMNFLDKQKRQPNVRERVEGFDKTENVGISIFGGINVE
jgi:hypothetical protein